MVRRQDGGRAAATRATGEPESAKGPSVPRAGTSGRNENASRASGAAAGSPGNGGQAPGAGARSPRARSAGPGPFAIRPNPVNVKLIYAAYLASLAMPFVAIGGVFVAHQAMKAKPTAWLATHYVFQIRTFWIGLALNLVAYALSFAGAGLFLFPLIAVWVVARSVKGLIRVANRAPVENPNGFFV